MFADKNSVEYCIFNILNNAFKYSKGAGDIILGFLLLTNQFILNIDFGTNPEQSVKII
jgi:signal transduction histidine kinase